MTLFLACLCLNIQMSVRLWKLHICKFSLTDLYACVYLDAYKLKQEVKPEIYLIVQEVSALGSCLLWGVSVFFLFLHQRLRLKE